MKKLEVTTPTIIWPDFKAQLAKTKISQIDSSKKGCRGCEWIAEPLSLEVMEQCLPYYQARNNHLRTIIKLTSETKGILLMHHEVLQLAWEEADSLMESVEQQTHIYMAPYKSHIWVESTWPAPRAYRIKTDKLLIKGIVSQL